MGILDKLFSREPKPGLPQPVGEDNFEPEVLASDLPATVLFYSTTCPSCHVMTGLLKELGPQLVDKVRLFTLNVSYHPHMARIHQIQSVPTLILFRDGRARERITGLIPLEPLKAKLLSPTVTSD